MSVLPAWPAAAASLVVAVSDDGGKPVEDAVIELAAEKPAVTSHVPAEASIDQRREMFTSLVSLVRKGGHIVFFNHDTTMHQVYSFSAVKQFQFEIRQGQHSDPVTFDKPGVAAVGCNIHDQMITYVYVSEAPYAALSGPSGQAKFEDLPPGTYEARIWHPRLRSGEQPAPHRITIARSDASDSFSLRLVPPARRGMHMGSY